ncbi:MAG: TatD DNase family protein [Halioglobus sp.]|jgi:TatD DNase family protein
MSKKARREIPCFKTPIIETHCHLDYLDEEQLTTTLAKAAEVGIEKIITIAVSPGNLAKVRDLTQRADNIWGTQGIHPHEAELFNSDVEAEIREKSAGERILAIGEIGLDYYYDHADRAVQRTVFERQLQMAVDCHLPVVIHTREADEDMQAILKNFSTSLGGRGVIHSFTSGLPLAKFCINEGFSLGFNGITTFNSAENVREVVTSTPIEKIVLETDAPYLTPVPYRGRPNAPFYLPFIAETVAQLKDMEIESFLKQVYDNSERLFFTQTQQQSVL